MPHEQTANVRPYTFYEGKSSSRAQNRHFPSLTHSLSLETTEIQVEEVKVTLKGNSVWAPSEFLRYFMRGKDFLGRYLQ